MVRCAAVLYCEVMPSRSPTSLPPRPPRVWAHLKGRGSLAGTGDQLAVVAITSDGCETCVHMFPTVLALAKGMAGAARRLLAFAS
eukprot:688943-Pyramimonas_sp.AAC.2